MIAVGKRTTITLQGGATYSGQSVETIARREWGRRARFTPSLNPNTPEAGHIVHPSAYDPKVSHIIAPVLHIETT